MPGTLIAADLDGKQLDSILANSAAITVPITSGTLMPFVRSGDLLTQCANRTYVVAVVIDTFSVATGAFNVCLGSAGSLSSTTGDWLAVATVSASLTPGFQIFGFGFNIGAQVPVYTSTSMDFSVLIVNPVTTAAGATCRMYLVGVSY